MAEYTVKFVAVTGTQDNPQTIPFSVLGDITSGEVLPGEFKEPPMIGVVGSYQDLEANVVPESITTTSFQIALSNMGKLKDYGHFHLEVIGESA